MAEQNGKVEANIRYGRLLEAVHISGYTRERAYDEVESLLEGDAWKQVGPGYDDVNDFLRSIDLSQFNHKGEGRKKLFQRIKELQPDASNRAIADMTGVNHTTIGRDLSGANAPLGCEDNNESAEEVSDNGVFAPSDPIPPSEPEPASEEDDQPDDEPEPPPAPPPPKYPHSDRLKNWLARLASETQIIRIEMGGIKAILSERSKWNWREVREYTLPQLRDLAKVVSEFREEIANAIEQQ